ncbi:putative membrane protein [Terriglobus roseus]|uniref:Putative membrane protein n=2 Tax=Terriglobus roseus TaxID=392734 RepID=A0A1G7FAL3_9BACT|nr:putative membrane protein [Terriglobus roseus]
MKGFKTGHPVPEVGVPERAMTKETKKLPAPARDILKGALAGMIGGLVATAAKTVAEKVYPPHPELARRDSDDKKLMPWVLGAAAGAAYGALAELYPPVTDRHGANFGMTMMAVTHEGVLPALGLLERPDPHSGREHRSEMVTHVVYGVVCETVRGLARRAL